MESYNKGIGIPALSDVESATMRAMLGTRCFGTAGLVIGSSAPAAVKIANTVPFCIDNVLYSKTTAEIAHTDLTVQAADTTKYYLLSLDSGGDGTITQGTATSLPACPADECPIGYFKVVTVAVTFVPATDSHAKSGVTTTYSNISQLPLTLI